MRVVAYRFRMFSKAVEQTHGSTLRLYTRSVRCSDDRAPYPAGIVERTQARRDRCHTRFWVRKGVVVVPAEPSGFPVQAFFAVGRGPACASRPPAPRQRLSLHGSRVGKREARLAHRPGRRHVRRPAAPSQAFRGLRRFPPRLNLGEHLI
jgi:hypothetical protein